MAGGMNKRGAWGPMQERLARARPPGVPSDPLPSTPAPTPAPTPAVPPPPPPPVKHCWVTDRHGRLPGLLLAWRQVEGAWDGRVMRPVRDEEGWIIVEEWLPAAFLEQA